MRSVPVTPPGRIATETPTRERRGILSSAQDGEERERKGRTSGARRRRRRLDVGWKLINGESRGSREEREMEAWMVEERRRRKVG